MVDSYNPNVHSWVTHPNIDGPTPIIHTPGDRVWVMLTYADELQSTWVVVGDGLNNGYDDDGGRIVSLPRSECHFYDDDEADNIASCIQADDDLLRYAIG